jgi:hypothetical protein
MKLARNSTLDCDFYYAHSSASRCLGAATLPCLHFAVSGQWFERAGVETVLQKVKEHFEVADRYAPPYGLIDVSASEDCYAGLVYGSVWPSDAPVHRYVEQANWVYAGSKARSKARGIYWGNYFGPAILERLGGRTRFLAAFQKQVNLHGNQGTRIWEFPNGILITLGVDPLRFSPGQVVPGSQVMWLTCELGTHGVLGAWDRWRDFRPGCLVSPESAHLAVAFAAQSNRGIAGPEAQWIAKQVAKARVVAKEYSALTEDAQLDAPILDKTYAHWLQDWHQEKTEYRPTDVINWMGLAFGQWLVDSLGMEWTIRDDRDCTPMGTVNGDDGKPVLIFPAQLVAWSLKSGNTVFFQPLYDVFFAPESQKRRLKSS